MTKKFKIGDHVLVLDDVIEGHVTSIDTNKISILTSEGFTLEFQPNELLIQPKADIEVELNDVAITKIESDSQPNINAKFSKSSRRQREAPPFEVDLHIDKLVASTQGMSKHDMLTLQIETAQRQLEFAIKKRIQNVVFIHGVGEGVLKMELEYLLSRYPVKIEDANFQKYGVGATEIYVFQNAN